MFEIGRICVKTAGREAGRFCIVVAKDKDKDFLIVTGPKEATKVRRRKCNFRHLEPTQFRVEIKENATDEDVMKAYEKDEIYAKLKLPRPGAEQERVSEERREKREEKKEKQEEQKEEKEIKREEKHEKHEHEKHEKREEHKEHKAGHKEEKPKKARAKKAGSKKAKKQ
jgi:large subunit ribosomal protein L14e